MRTQKLEYTSENTQFAGYVAWDDASAERRPGIVVFPEAFGLNDHARERADRLARLGYVAVAADLHGQGTVYEDMAQLGPAISGLYADRSAWRRRARAALDALLGIAQVDAQRIAAIGFCFGGTTAIELARTGAPLSAVATFHSGLLPALPEDAGKIRGKVLVCHGARDPIVKKEAIDTFMAELIRDNVDWQFVYYGNAAHSFTDPEADKRRMPALAYDRLSEGRSWKLMRQLLEEVF